MTTATTQQQQPASIMLSEDDKKQFEKGKQSDFLHIYIPTGRHVSFLQCDE